MAKEREDAKQWETMTLAPAGHVGDVLRVGGGKLSPSIAPDQGMELIQSPKGQE